MNTYQTIWNACFSQELTGITAIFRLVAALLMSGILGLERTRKQRPAGLRTYMLVCIGACVTMMTGLYIHANFAPTADPARLASQVISGIGFIGAGTIIVTGQQKIKGLTTAAGLWTTAALGIALGAGFLALAVGAFIVMLIVMFCADCLEQLYFRHLSRLSVRFILASPAALRHLSEALRHEGITLCSLEIGEVLNSVGISATGILRIPKGTAHGELLRKIMNIDGVIFAE